MPGLDTEERASSASGQSLIWDDDVRGNGGEWYSEEGESEAPVDDDPIRSDSEFMLGNAGPIVIFDRHSGPSSTRERRSHLDDAMPQSNLPLTQKRRCPPNLLESLKASLKLLLLRPEVEAEFRSRCQAMRQLRLSRSTVQLMPKRMRREALLKKRLKKSKTVCLEEFPASQTR